MLPPIGIAAGIGAEYFDLGDTLPQNSLGSGLNVPLHPVSDSGDDLAVHGCGLRKRYFSDANELNGEGRATGAIADCVDRLEDRPIPDGDGIAARARCIDLGLAPCFFGGSRLCVRR
jgi:hypothetical protein